MQFASSTDINNIATTLGSNITNGVHSLWPVILILVSIPLCFYIIIKIMAIFFRSNLKEKNDYDGKVTYDKGGNVKFIEFDEKK